ncbi:NAD-dependent epimerase/dehydratase family protein [Pseudonocardia spinosispora]|uniref:NAD-dependent epimerase/dehydratase family protein n=1 Tax=Pseudonocardia spinosispora TaxID=103441 RepID=UPI00040B04F3|nr:NAD(P)-dependent oxidoreductase [Pseudonocardia spinosispora]
MPVLVTGSAGLIGHAVRTRLEARGTSVVPVDRDARSVDGIEQVACDVTDPVALERIVASRRVTAVVHCGAASGPTVESDNPRGVVEVNVGGTANLLEISRRHRIRRFVYCSSISAYGVTPPAPVPESAPLRPLDVYGATKAAGEHLVAAYAAQHGLDGVSLRIATVFGPRRRTDCLIRTLLRDAAAGRATSVAIAADAPQQYVHVDDVAAAVVAALDADGVIGPYNVAGGTVQTVQDVIDRVHRIDPRCRATPAPADPGGAQLWPARLDLAAAAQALGWRPVKNSDDAVHEYRRWLEHHEA